MTTIAYRDGVLAADTLTTANGNRDGYVSKARRIGHLLVVWSGSVPVGIRFHQWVADGMKGESPYHNADAGNGIVVSDAGIVCWSSKGPWPVTTDFYALGSGCEFATGAMEMGATAEEAVRVAMKHNTDTGGKITVLRLKPTPQNWGEILNFEMAKRHST